MRDRPPELRDVGVVQQPDARAARALGEPEQVREEGLHPAEAPRREGRASAPRAPGREADAADAGTGRLPRRAGRRSVQAGALPLLTQGRSYKGRSRKYRESPVLR